LGGVSRAKSNFAS